MEEKLVVPHDGSQTFNQTILRRNLFNMFKLKSTSVSVGIALFWQVTAPVFAQDYGLLLGLRQGGNYNAMVQLSAEEGPRQESKEDVMDDSATYRTLWLRTQEGKLKLTAEKTSLLVPGEEGFWRIDVKHSVYNDYNEDFVWVNPPPDSDAPANPFLANKEGIEAFDVAMLPKPQGIEFQHGEQCIGYHYRDILFVENNHIGISSVNSQTCLGTGSSTGDSGLQILPLETMDPVNFTELLGPDTGKLFTTTAAEYQKQHPNIKEWGNLSGGIVRNNGQWTIEGHYALAKNEYTNFEVTAAPIPADLAKPTSLALPWATIKKQIPDAVDAFSSPKQDILVVLTKSRLLGFALKEGKINPRQPMLRLIIKQPVSVVMVQWAEGQFVDNWTQELESLGPKPRKSWFTEPRADNQQEEGETFQLLGVVTTEAGTALNIRENFGESSQLLAKMEKNSKVQILDFLGNWYKVELEDGQTGYVLSEYLKVLPRLPYIRAGCPAGACSYGKWSLNESVTLYEQPSFDSATLAQLEAQQSLEAMEGQINTSQYGEILVIKDTEVKALPLDVASVDNKEILKLLKDDLLYDLESKGEGLHIVWYQGKLYYIEEGWDANHTAEVDRWGKVLFERKSDWWVQINVSEKNLQGWVANPNVQSVSEPAT